MSDAAEPITSLHWLERCDTCRHWLERTDYPGQGGCKQTNDFSGDTLARKLPANTLVQVQMYKSVGWLETAASFGCVLGEQLPSAPS